MHGLPGTYPISGRSAVGSAVALGASGRRFDFCRPDHTRARPGELHRPLVETGLKDWEAPELVTGHLRSIGREVQGSGLLSRGRASGSFVRIEHAPPGSMGERRVESASVADSISAPPARECESLLVHQQQPFFPALAQLDQSTGLRSRGLHVRIVCAGPYTWSASSMGDCTGL